MTLRGLSTRGGRTATGATTEGPQRSRLLGLSPRATLVMRGKSGAALPITDSAGAAVTEQIKVTPRPDAAVRVHRDRDSAVRGLLDDVRRLVAQLSRRRQHTTGLVDLVEYFRPSRTVAQGRRSRPRSPPGRCCAQGRSRSTTNCPSPACPTAPNATCNVPVELATQSGGGSSPPSPGTGIAPAGAALTAPGHGQPDYERQRRAPPEPTYVRRPSLVDRRRRRR